MSRRAVLFDAAGTLLLTAEPVGETYARFLRKAGVEIPAWRLEDAFARVQRRAPPMVFPDAAPDEIPGRERDWWRWRLRETIRAADSEARVPDFDGLFASLWDHFAAPEAWRAAEGAAEALEALGTAGLAIAVVSNMDHRLDAILHGIGLAPHIDVVVRPAHAGAAKPDPGIFRAALDRLGVPAGRATYVGDDAERDLAAARAVGLAAIDVGELATLAELPRRIEECASPQEADR